MATLGEEIDALVAEWYAAQGLPVPSEEIGVGAEIDRADREQLAAEIGSTLGATAMREAAKAAAAAPPPAEETLEQKAARLAAAIGPKPEFGSQDYWAWTQRKRAAENAERAAKGLPPLPTAKEKAAAAAAAKAEREAKKAAKAAKK